MRHQTTTRTNCGDYCDYTNINNKTHSHNNSHPNNTAFSDPLNPTFPLMTSPVNIARTSNINDFLHTFSIGLEFTRIFLLLLLKPRPALLVSTTVLFSDMPAQSFPSLRLLIFIGIGGYGLSLARSHTVGVNYLLLLLPAELK